MSSSGRKQIRSNKAQLAKLVEYMRNNNMVAIREYVGPHGTRRMDAKWSRLASLLNNLGPNKSVEQWKQTWRDLKRKLRKEDVMASREQSDNISNNPLSGNIARILGNASSNGIGPEKSEISQRVSILFDDDTDMPTEVIEYEHNDVVREAQPTSNGKTKRNGTSETLPSNHFLTLQEDHNLILTRICGLMEEANTLRKEKNFLLREQIRLSKRRGNISNQPKLSF